MKRIIPLLFLLCSCTKTVYLPIVEKEVEYKHSVDSIYQSDTVRIYIKGDTILKESIRFIYKFKCDTAYIQKIDSIPYPVEVEKTKVVTPTWAWYTLVISIICVVYLSVVIWKKIRNLRL